MTSAGASAPAGDDPNFGLESGDRTCSRSDPECEHDRVAGRAVHALNVAVRNACAAELKTERKFGASLHLHSAAVESAVWDSFLMFARKFRRTECAQIPTRLSPAVCGAGVERHTREAGLSDAAIESFTAAVVGAVARLTLDAGVLAKAFQFVNNALDSDAESPPARVVSVSNPSSPSPSTAPPAPARPSGARVSAAAPTAEERAALERADTLRLSGGSGGTEPLARLSSDLLSRFNGLVSQSNWVAHIVEALERVLSGKDVKGREYVPLIRKNVGPVVSLVWQTLIRMGVSGVLKYTTKATDAQVNPFSKKACAELMAEHHVPNNKIKSIVSHTTRALLGSQMFVNAINDAVGAVHSAAARPLPPPHPVASASAAGTGAPAIGAPGTGASGVSAEGPGAGGGGGWRRHECSERRARSSPTTAL